MESLKARLILLVIWIISGILTFTILPICFILFFSLGMTLPLWLFGDPLPPKKNTLCRRCKKKKATTRQHYWIHNRTIPTGAIALCDKCEKIYDHRYNWRENQ